MSRSYKQNPIRGNTAAVSEKYDKHRWAGQRRQNAKTALRHGQEVALCRASVTQYGAKDGKRYDPLCSLRK